MAEPGPSQTGQDDAPAPQVLVEGWSQTDQGSFESQRGAAPLAARVIGLIIFVVTTAVIVAILAAVVLPLAIIFLGIALLVIVYLITRAYIVAFIAKFRDPARGRRNVTIRRPEDSGQP